MSGNGNRPPYMEKDHPTAARARAILHLKTTDTLTTKKLTESFGTFHVRSGHQSANTPMDMVPPFLQQPFSAQPIVFHVLQYEAG